MSIFGNVASILGQQVARQTGLPIPVSITPLPSPVAPPADSYVAAGPALPTFSPAANFGPTDGMPPPETAGQRIALKATDTAADAAMAATIGAIVGGMTANPFIGIAAGILAGALISAVGSEMRGR